MKVSGAELFVRALREEGVRHLFGFPGGVVIPVFDVLYSNDVEPLAFPSPVKVAVATTAPVEGAAAEPQVEFRAVTVPIVVLFTAQAGTATADVTCVALPFTPSGSEKVTR